MNESVAERVCGLDEGEGEARWWLGINLATIKATPDTFLFGPGAVPHRSTVDSGPARMLFVLSPPGFEKFIYATSEPAKENVLPSPPEEPPDPAEMEQIGAL